MEESEEAGVRRGGGEGEREEEMVSERWARKNLQKTDLFIYFYCYFYFIFYFLQLYCPNGISSTRNSGCLPRGKQAATELHYPTYCACWVF